MRILMAGLLLVLALAFPAGAAEVVLDTDFSSDPGVVSLAGDWVVKDGVLVNQVIDHDATIGYIPVPQDGKKIIYEYKVTYKETTAADSFGPLGGIIIMIQEPTVRNAAYFLYGARPYLKLVKTGADDTFQNLQTAWTDARFATVPGQTVEYRIEFTPDSGELVVYANGQLVTAWKDANPTKTGAYVAFRTNATIMEVDFLRVSVER